MKVESEQFSTEYLLLITPSECAHVIFLPVFMNIQIHINVFIGMPDRVTHAHTFILVCRCSDIQHAHICGYLTNTQYTF